MSWLFSRVLVEEFSEAICSDGEQFVRSSGSPTPQAYLSQDKMKAFSRLSQFGMTFEPLTEDRGEKLCKLYREAFPVRTSLPQEKAQESTENEAECGPRWRGSFAKYDPDSCSWKTHQCSLLGGLTAYSETWPRWGSMRNGECWERQTSELRTKETEYGLWPTPTSQMAGEGPLLQNLVTKNGGPPVPQERLYKPKTGNHVQITLNRAVKMWPTPDANCAARGTTPKWKPKRKSGHPAQYSINQAVRDKEGVIGQLNPNWVEWLMGWPVGWTDLKPLETDKFQKWLDEHSQY